MFRVEIGKTVHRPRTYVLGVLLAASAVLPVVVLSLTTGSGGPPFFDLIRRNGLFAALTAVALIQPFFLPVGAGLLSGEAIAGEASAGTLRYLLVRPVGRVRLVLSKYAAVMTTLVAAVAWVALVGLVAGAIVFGFGPLPTLSGSTLATASGLVRILAAAAYVAAGVAGLAAIGIFISTLTTSAPGAIAGTVIVSIASEIVDSLPGLHTIHPFLLTHQWLAWADLFRDPIAWDAMTRGIELAVVYTALFLAAALLVFTRKDVTA